MQKQKLQLKQGINLSPQQIQFLSLLQIPLASLHSRIQEELEENPALEESENSEDINIDELEEENNNSEVGPQEFSKVWKICKFPEYS